MNEIQTNQVELNFVQSADAILCSIEFEAVGDTRFKLSTSLFALMGKEIPRAKHDTKSLDYLGIKIHEDKMLPDDTMIVFRNGEIIKIIKFEKEENNVVD